MDLLERIAAFLNVRNGYGYGKGNGNGCGCGYGSGYGNGFGNGCGYGSGDGNGYGSGSGYGKGNGNGDGNGDGYSFGDGYGYGSGDGNGYGVKEINGMSVHYVDDVPTIITNVRGQLATGYTIRYNTIVVPCFIARVGDYFGHGETSHDAMKAARIKYEENRPLSERIDDFMKEFPSLESKGTGRQFYEWHHILTGSCEFGRNEFCKVHGVEMDAVYTVGYFLNLVRNNFGREAIAEVLNEFNNQR